MPGFLNHQGYLSGREDCPDQEEGNIAGAVGRDPVGETPSSRAHVHREIHESTPYRPPVLAVGSARLAPARPGCVPGQATWQSRLSEAQEGHGFTIEACSGALPERKSALPVGESPYPGGAFAVHHWDRTAPRAH